MRHSIRRGLFVAAASATALALAACSSPAPTTGGDTNFDPITSIKLQLQWLPQAQFAGYFVALDQGYFTDEGFDTVEIVPSGGDIVPQDALAAGD
ncbi:MAG: ABC transporter substrate-binding protein, partial [Pseudolysinimonas sp.]